MSELEARRAVDAARARVGALIVERTHAVEEARRLRERARAGEALGELAELAERYEAHADALAAELEAARRTAHEAEVLLERLRAPGG